METIDGLQKIKMDLWSVLITFGNISDRHEIYLRLKSAHIAGLISPHLYDLLIVQAHVIVI